MAPLPASEMACPARQTRFALSRTTPQEFAPVGWLFGLLRSAAGRWVLVAAMVAAITANVVQRVIETSEVYFFWVPLAWGVIYALAAGMVGRSGGYCSRELELRNG